MDSLWNAYVTWQEHTGYITTEFNEFKDSLLNKKIIRQKMRRIQDKKHKKRTYETNKIPLSVFDDKRFVLNHGIHRLAYFHKDID